MKEQIDIALVDADIICYSCGFAAQETTYQTSDGELHATLGKAKKHAEAKELYDKEVVAFVEAEPKSHALQLAKNLLLRVEDRLDPKEMWLFLSGKNNFREKVATIRPYKGNRTADKPLHYQAIKDYLVDKWKAEIIDDMEADDALGIYQKSNTCIVTIDKDLNMVEGLHYNWRHDTIYNVTELEALRNFYIQLLTGDTTDNIPGVPGIGSSRAVKALRGLTTEEDMYWKTLEIYSTKYEKPYQALVENARLLWILRKESQVWESKH